MLRAEASPGTSAAQQKETQMNDPMSAFAGQPVHVEFSTAAVPPAGSVGRQIGPAPVLSTDCQARPTTQPKQVEQHFEVCRGCITPLAASPLAGKLNGEGFAMLPEDCGFDGQLFPLNARSNEQGFFEVNIAIHENELGRILVCCGFDFGVYYWIGTNGREAIEDAILVLRDCVGASHAVRLDVRRAISRVLLPE